MEILIWHYLMILVEAAALFFLYTNLLVIYYRTGKFVNKYDFFTVLVYSIGSMIFRYQS